MGQREEAQKRREREALERKEESEDDSEGSDDDSAENESDSESESESSDEELVLDTYQDMKDQVDFLVKEWKKLNKIVGSLKQKSLGNDVKIKQLRGDLKQLRSGTASIAATAVDANDDLLDL